MALTISKAGRDRSFRDSDHLSTQCPSAMKQARVFPKPEPVLRIKRDMHPWMSPYLATFAHPVFGVSNPEGSVEINNLPAGTFQLKPLPRKERCPDAVGPGFGRRDQTDHGHL